MSKLETTLPVLGILGGTFDPIHKGHLACAHAALTEFEMDKVKFIPCANTPHRAQPGRSPEQRCAMVALALEDYPQFELDTRECQRSELSFSIDTLESLRKELGAKQSLVFMLGADAFEHILSWHRYEDILSNGHLLVIQRPGYATQDSQQKTHHTDALKNYVLNNESKDASCFKRSSHGSIVFFEGPMMDISASQVRDSFDFSNSTNIAQDIQRISKALPEKVKNYIHQNAIYVQKPYS